MNPDIRPLTFYEIFDRGIKQTLATYIELVKVVLVIVAPLEAVIFVFMALFGNGFLSNMLNYFGLLIAQPLAVGAVMYMLGRAYVGQDADWRNSLNFATQRIMYLVLLALLSGVLMSIGFLLCFIPGIYLMAVWFVAMPVLIFEGLRDMTALERSRKLTTGRVFNVLGVTLAGGFCAGIAAMILSFIIVIPFLIFGSWLFSALGYAVGTTVGVALIAPFLASVTLQQYLDLRARTEGLTVEQFQAIVAGLDGPSAPPAAS